MDPELPEGRRRPAQAGLIRTRLNTETAPSPTGHFWWHTLSQHSVWPQGTSRRRGLLVSSSRSFPACVRSHLPAVGEGDAPRTLVSPPDRKCPGSHRAAQAQSAAGSVQGLPCQGLGSLGRPQPGQGGRGCPKPRLKPVAAVRVWGVCFFSIKLHGRRAVSQAPCSGVRLEFSATL